MKIFVVTMYRGGNREKHSYVLGTFSNRNMAEKWGEDEEIFRGNKYKSDITIFILDNPAICPKEDE